MFDINTNKDQVHSERDVLKTFLEVADSIGLTIPEDTQTLRRWLDAPLKDGILWPPNEVLSLMALAQHHGVPTRLLDWTRNSLKAAWFAATEAALSHDASGLLSVWALSIELLGMIPHEPKPFTVITAPSATNSNLRAQEGLFTLLHHIRYDESPVDRTPFDAMLRATFARYSVKAPGPWFHKVTLPQSEACNLEYGLALEGITRAVLFPDFYGVAAALRDSARFQRNDGPGARRTAARLNGLTFSYESKVRLGTTPGDTPRSTPKSGTD